MIKELSADQIDRIMDIWLQTNIKAHDFLPEEYWVNNYEVVKNTYIPASKTYVYEENHEIKGFISILPNGFIGALFIDSSYQRQGIGESLIRYCKSLYDKLSLAVYAENEQAVAFYKKNNFTIEAEGQNEDSGSLEYLMLWTK